MMAQVSISSQGDFLRQFLDRMVRDVDVDSHGHATIHSGHFMVSCVHEDAEDADSSLQPSVKEETEERQEGYNFDNAEREPSDSYKFGARSTNQLSIDASLATLFEHMTLAYSGKITSPKWKNFKGIKVKLKDKIRLNNIIWREWHMQYIKRQKPIICQFEAPISERTHSKPEAVVLEGKYWKRRLECLTTEYKKWRLFFKDRFSRVRKNSGLMEEVELSSELGQYDRLGKGNASRMGAQFASNKFYDEQMTVEEDYFSAFSDDTLFSSLNQPFAFPDPREISQQGFGDFVQPHLLQLQPSLDESMDTLPPLPVLSDFRDFGRGTGYRNTSRKMADAGLFDILLGEQEFSYEPSQQSSEQGTSLNEQQSTTANDAYLIDQLKQQLMGDSSETSMSDLFSASDSGKYLTEVSDLMATATTTCQEDPFFSSGMCSKRVVTQQEPQLCTSNQPFQPPRSQVVQLNALLTESKPMVLADNQCGFAQNTSVGLPVFSGSTCNSLYQLLPDGSRVAVMQGEVAPSSAQVQPWLQQSPAASVSSSARYALGSVSLGTTSQQQQQQQTSADFAASLLCLQNLNQSQAPSNTCRRGSTGSLQPGKGKKHVTFLCPQSLPVQSTSKTKPRPLAPAPASCDTSTKTSSGPMETSRAKTAPSLDREQQSGILAQLLTQGKPKPFKPIRGVTERGGGGGTSCLSSFAAPTKKLPPSSSTSSQLSFFSVSREPPTSPANQALRSQPLRQPPSVNDFHRKLLSAAVSQTFGVEKAAAQEVTASLLNDMFDGAFSSPSSAASTTLPSVSMTSSMVRSRNPSNESNASQTDEGTQPTEHQRGNRKFLHLSAEQKRRSNIKYGFETLNQMVPELNAMSSGKINKATTLQKASDCCRRMKQERLAVKQEMDAFRREIDELQAQISSCQSQLPATGVPVVRPQTNRSKVLFEEYIRNRTLANWKFWIFSFLIRPLFEVYDENVVTTSAEAFCQSVLTWLQQQCSLVSLRPAVLKALRELSTTTSILVDPSSMPQQATEAVSRSRHSSDHSSFT